MKFTGRGKLRKRRRERIEEARTKGIRKLDSSNKVAAVPVGGARYLLPDEEMRKYWVVYPSINTKILWITPFGIIRAYQ